jgi:hypothetical protein
MTTPTISKTELPTTIPNQLAKIYPKISYNRATTLIVLVHLKWKTTAGITD